MGAESGETGAPRRVVPTALVPILWAAGGYLVLQLLILAVRGMGAATLGPPRATGGGLGAAVAHPQLTSTLFVVLLAILWNSAHWSAIYAMIAQATLRWLGWTSPLAYALGGAAGAYLIQAVTAWAGVHLTFADFFSEIAGGFLVGYVYRVSAGTSSMEPS